MKQFTLVLSVFMLSVIYSFGYDDDKVDLSNILTWGIPSLKNLDIPTPDGKPLKPAIVELGHKLFFDPRLSNSNLTSCATCHNPQKGLSDGLPLFKGDNGKIGARRSPVIQNLAWSATLFWDGRAESLEQQALMPIEAEGEMNQDMSSLVKELAEAGYKPLFKSAFGQEADITAETIAKAIADFERSLVSHDSAFDRFTAGDKDAMTESQKRGMALFMTKANCATCHSGPNFTDDSFHDLGLADADLGRYNVLPLASVRHAFKTPGLRDVAKRGPFMHNGSLETLEDVIDYYDRGGDYLDREGNPDMKKLDLSMTEKRDLLNFMTALNGKGAVDISTPELPGY